MGISDLNFDFGFIGLFVLFGVPFLLYYIIFKFFDWISDKIESVRFDTKTPEGFMEFDRYLSDKYRKKLERKKSKPKLTKFLDYLLTFSLVGGYFLLVFVWGFFLVQIME